MIIYPLGFDGRLRAGLLLLVVLVTGGTASWARGPLSVVVPLPVDHPVSLPLAERTPYAWRQGVGNWGETVAAKLYRARGFDTVFSLKSTGGQGIDCIALKRNEAGELIDARINETKTGTNPGRLNETEYGPQLGRNWTAQKLREARNSGPTTKEVAADIRRYCKKRGITTDQLGEVYEINTRTGTCVLRDVTTGAEVSNQSLPGLLTALERQAAHGGVDPWAATASRSFPEIQATSMANWLGRGQTMAALESSGETAAMRTAAEATMEGSGKAIARIGLRYAGPAALALAAGYDAYQSYAAVADYRANRIDQRQMTVVLSRIGGGWVGMAGGAWAGGQLGAFGGPFAEVTVPVGAFFGGIIGYFGGSHGGEQISNGIYDRMDERVRTQVDNWLLATSYGQAHR